LSKLELADSLASKSEVTDKEAEEISDKIEEGRSDRE